MVRKKVGDVVLYSDIMLPVGQEVMFPEAQRVDKSVQVLQFIVEFNEAEHLS